MADSQKMLSREYVYDRFAGITQIPESKLEFRLSFAPLDSDDDDPGPWLVGPAPDGVPFPAKPFAILHVHDLHRHLAKTKPTLHAIQGFANRYGALGVGKELVDEAPSDKGLRGRKVWSGESPNQWSREIAELSSLIKFWDLIRKGEVGLLGQIVVWPSPREVRIRMVKTEEGLDIDRTVRLFRNTGGRLPVFEEIKKEIEQGDGGGYLGIEETMLALRGSNTASEYLLDIWEFGDPIEPAKFFLADRITNKLNEHTSVRMLPVYRDSPEAAKRRISTGVFNQIHGVLGAAYARFAVDLCGRLGPMKTCSGCGNEFEQRRRDQIYCDTGCRARSGQRRRRARPP